MSEDLVLAVEIFMLFLVWFMCAVLYQNVNQIKATTEEFKDMSLHHHFYGRLIIFHTLGNCKFEPININNIQFLCLAEDGKK